MAKEPGIGALSELAYKGTDSHVDPKNRRIYLVGEVGEESVARFLLGFHMLDATSGDIDLVICSVGGDTNGGFGIYDSLHLAQNRVTAKVFGEALSIAALILQGADKRLLS